MCAIATSAIGAEKDYPIQVRRTPDSVPYGLIGDVDGRVTPAPTLLVFAHGMEVMRTQPGYTQVAGILAPQGWISVIVEPPCHGEDSRPGEPAQLEGWRSRMEQREDFIGTFNAKASKILDLLIAEKLSDPNRIAVCGTSRGGFLAYHFAASDARVKATAGISPVTRLAALHEFSLVSPELTGKLDVAHAAPKLAGRAVWLSIGNNDLRVSTDDAIAFTREVIRASAKPDQPNSVIPVELLVGPAAGHTKIDNAHELLAEWLVRQCSATNQPKGK